MIILDTNVLSELVRPSPNAVVSGWVKGCASSSLFTTSITQAEMLLGVEILPSGKRRDVLEQRVRMMFDQDFAGHILPFDSDAAIAFAHIAALRRRSGRAQSNFDTQVAAIALSRGAAVATRNASDFEGCGITVHDPWT